jgi:copper homeostasis protein
MSHFIECCCQRAADARIAEAHGASRIELCEDLAHDGVTPSLDNIRETLLAVSIPVNVLIRCRAGNFIYSNEEVDAMTRSIALCRDLQVCTPDGEVRRVNAVVIGALDEEGDIDVNAVSRMVDEARRPGSHLTITFHRAFDVCRDPIEAYSVICSLGIERILTSGQAPSAVEGSSLLAMLVERSHSCPTQILVGGGVRPTNIDMLVEQTAAEEYHSSYLLWN